jgi:hypothetical protein
MNGFDLVDHDHMGDLSDWWKRRDRMLAKKGECCWRLYLDQPADAEEAEGRIDHHPLDLEHLLVMGIAFSCLVNEATG